MNDREWRWSFLFALVMGANAHVAGIADAVPKNSRQLVLVVAPDWESTRALLRRYERGRGEARWREVGEGCDALLGEHGLAWGLGLHASTRGDARRKHEGDRCAPTGVFRLLFAFGKQSASQFGIARFPYEQLAPDSEAVDDPSSRFYNRIVRRSQIASADWKSSERMAEIADYELGVAVAHNPKNIPGGGSCIFIHGWRGERTGTAGCTVVREPHLLELVRWLDAEKHPLLVQLPRSEVPAKFP